MKCNQADDVNDGCWGMKTIAAEIENHFFLLLLLVDFCVSCHFPPFLRKAHEMKGRRIKCAVFLGQLNVR